MFDVLAMCKCAMLTLLIATHIRSSGVKLAPPALTDIETCLQESVPYI